MTVYIVAFAVFWVVAGVSIFHRCDTYPERWWWQRRRRDHETE